MSFNKKKEETTSSSSSSSSSSTSSSEELKCSEDMVLCNKRVNFNYAEADPTMIEDPRVIKNMLILEKDTIPHCDYFRTVQTDIKPFMRKFVTIWMLELCDEQRTEEQVFPLSINYMDRFLCLCPISRQQLQLLGATCLLLASKIRQCYALSVDLLCAYTDCTIIPEQLKSWELLVLSTLQWNISAITGFDYIDHILERVPWGSENIHIRRHSHTLVSVCLTEASFIQSDPSVLASACICAATRGINAPSARYALADVCRLTQVDPIEVEFTVRHIEHIVSTQAAAMQKQQQQHQQHQQQNQQLLTKSQYHHHHHHHHHHVTTNKLPTACGTEVCLPETSTDIQNIYF